MVEPRTDELLPVEEEWRCGSERDDPDDEDEGPGPAFGQSGLEGEDNPEETITGYQGQGQNARRQRHNCNTQDNTTHLCMQSDMYVGGRVVWPRRSNVSLASHFDQFVCHLKILLV